jgi:Flp pilus assembly protein TadG
MSLSLKKFVGCERGTQTIEFALLLPFLILLFASAVEMGRMFYTYTTLQKATEVGARYLSTKQLSNGSYTGVMCGSISCITAATNLVVCGKESSCSGETPGVPNLSSTNVTITSPGTGVGARYLTVNVSYGYQPLAFNLGNLTGVSQLSLNYTFTPSIKMRYML